MSQMLERLAEPDNIAVLSIIPLVCGVLAVYWWRARRADAGDLGQPAHMIDVWPHLVRIELLVAIGIMLLLTVWSILVDAPLEQAADPLSQPDPSKAPWYFLGLQELLVYFDPWIAGVMLPILIIFGLMAIPYLDPNPAGNGEFAWRSRRFAVLTFLFGFIGLWLIPIFIGVFFRGPGWGFFMPWEIWEPGRSPPIASRNLSDLVGATSRTAAFCVGMAACALWYAPAALYWRWKRDRPAMTALGRTRYILVAFLFLTMLAIPAKMVLRWTLGLKYIWVTPWFNI